MIRNLALAATLALALVPAHDPGPEQPPGVVCDRFSVCFVCQDGLCFLPIPGLGGLPIPGLPLLGGDA